MFGGVLVARYQLVAITAGLDREVLVAEVFKLQWHAEVFAL